jgi:hypothetical protein
MFILKIRYLPVTAAVWFHINVINYLRKLNVIRALLAKGYWLSLRLNCNTDLYAFICISVFGMWFGRVAINYTEDGEWRERIIQRQVMLKPDCVLKHYAILPAAINLSKCLESDIVRFFKRTHLEMTVISLFFHLT